MVFRKFSPLFIVTYFLCSCGNAKESSILSGTDNSSPLTRHYSEGELLRYEMSGVNEDRNGKRVYTAESEGIVRKSGKDVFFEETIWTSLIVDGQQIELSPGSLKFRQSLSLDKKFTMPFPDISSVQAGLIGPIFDLMTFYVDLHPNLHQNKLLQVGHQISVPHGRPNSWADGTRVIIGEDCIDFVLTLLELNTRQAKLRVQHLLPSKQCVNLPSEWMKKPIGKQPNNWVQVTKEPTGYTASVGQETFVVDLSVERPSGRITSAKMDNPVDVVERKCSDEALTNCEDPISYGVHRSIEIRSKS